MKEKKKIDGQEKNGMITNQKLTPSLRKTKRNKHNVLEVKTPFSTLIVKF